MSTDVLSGIAYVLLDIDGTLVDSNELHVEAWDQAFRRYGHPLERSAIREQIGKGGDQLVPALQPRLSESVAAAIAAAHDEIFRSQYLRQVRAFDRAREFVEGLKRRGMQVVLASSAKRIEVDYYIRLLRIGSLIAASTCADDVARSKPAGDLFAAALEKAGCTTPATALAVGDTPYDIVAAAKCGVGTLAVLSGGFPEDALRSAGARALYGDVGDILDAFNRQPTHQ